MDALSSGIYQGAMTYSELSKHGDFGVGTFDSLDGEMVALDGRFYQVRSDGIVSRVKGNETAPFAVVTTFDSAMRFNVTQSTSLAALSALIDKMLPSLNFFYAVKVHGTFSDITVRSVPKQYPPFPPLATAVAEQSLFPQHDIEGTLVGFRSPAFVRGINQVGYHFHFISDDEKAGGHALSFDIQSATVDVDILRAQSTFLPDNQPLSGRNATASVDHRHRRESDFLLRLAIRRDYYRCAVTGAAFDRAIEASSEALRIVGSGARPIAAQQPRDGSVVIGVHVRAIQFDSPREILDRVRKIPQP